MHKKIIKKFPVLLLVLLHSFFVSASDREHQRVELQKLVEERENRFGDYSRAAASRSGFFGNKTKGDLKRQMEIMTQIVKTDNKIISTLNNFLDYRTFQRTEMSYSQAELDSKNRRLDELTTTLSKKLKDSEATKKTMALKLRWAKLLNYILLASLAGLSFLLWKAKRFNRLSAHP